jgi:hypothetical protein
MCDEKRKMSDEIAKANFFTPSFPIKRQRKDAISGAINM